METDSHEAIRGNFRAAKTNLSWKLLSTLKPGVLSLIWLRSQLSYSKKKFPPEKLKFTRSPLKILNYERNSTAKYERSDDVVYDAK